MNPNIHRVLDGELSAQSLSALERAELAETAAQIDAVLRAVPVEPVPDLAAGVLGRIRRESSRTRGRVPSRWRSAADWFWRPRSVSFTWRPAYALAASAVFVAALSVNSLRPRPIDTAHTRPQVFTQFVLSAPGAKAVAVAGDFSGWKPVHVMTRLRAGVWTVVVPLDPGVHDYAFLVDGERWIPDPAAPAVKDGFGGVNSRVAVLSPDNGRG
jgi:hypothetical protein